LRPLEIVVRCARATTFVSTARRAAALALLGNAERAHLERLRASSVREDYLAAHALARLTLGDLAGCDPARVAFQRGPHGRPEVARPWRARALRFSISDADGLVLCAVARGCVVGADIESARSLGADPLGVAAAVCTEREHDALRLGPRSLLAERVLRVWTLKEAVAKATGFGVHLSLADIGFEVREEELSAGAFHAQATGADGSDWRVMWLPITALHLAAVAVPARQADGATVSFERAQVAAHLAYRQPA
jgi:4'-phosphopantetheinyl transferase